ncbi:MAG: hypothetical protein R3C20_04770 [Planctomycetaceae bacterium]
MSKLYQVLMTYVTRRFLMLMLCLMVPGTLLSIVTADKNSLTFAGFTFGPMLMLTFWLGIHLKQQIARPEATLVPDYRRWHLIVAFLMWSVPLLTAFAFSRASGSSPLATCGLSLLVWTVSYSAGACPGWWLAIPYSLGIATAFSPVLRATLGDFLMGGAPQASWFLMSLALGAACLLFHHLFSLTEDDPDYGKVMPMDVWDLKAATIRRSRRVQMQPYNTLSWDWYLQPASKALEALSLRTATTLRERIMLWRLSADWPTNHVWFFMVVGSIQLMAIWLQSRALKESLDVRSVRLMLSLPCMFSLMLTWGQFLLIQQRWPRLGYESLRPFSRRTWVRDNGLMLLSNSITAQLAWWALFGIGTSIVIWPVNALAIYPQAIVEFSLWVIGAHFVVFGVSALASSYGSRMSMAIGILAATLVSQTSWIASNRMDDGDLARTTWVVSGVLLISGILLTVTAYRRWCRMDLP